MNKIMLLYPPGKAYQRSEDRAQCNIDDSAVATIHACNDIGYAAAVLNNRGYKVLLRDYQTEKTGYEEIKKEILSFLPDIIVISITNATILNDINFINWISCFHSCEFILKGAIFFDVPSHILETLDLHNANYLIGGEIDTVIGDLVDCILLNKGSIDNVNGILYKKDGVFKKTDFSKWFDNLDEIPFPARDLMRNELYPRPDTGEPMATIQVSRGCPCHCTYCLTPIISGTTVRKRSIENVFAEIEECYYKYGIRNFFFKADTFTIDAQWAMALCDKIISSDLHGKIEFTVNSRAKPLEAELLKKLKKAGCFMLAVGFESSSDDTLRKIKKGTTREDNIRAAKLIREHKLPLLGFFMIGFPWETKQDMLETLEFIFEIDPDFIEIHVALPYFGTELNLQCEQYSTVKSASWGNDYFSPNTIGTQTVSLDEIQKIRNNYLLKFYLRPKYIAKKMIYCLQKPITLKNYFVHGLKLLNSVFKKTDNG
ncbi:MAG: radical SAM protein [Clostridia bacterium]|nr:radical SAM protein [Clostridia bacterium]